MHPTQDHRSSSEQLKANQSGSGGVGATHSGSERLRADRSGSQRHAFRSERFNAFCRHGAAFWDLEIPSTAVDLILSVLRVFCIALDAEMPQVWHIRVTTSKTYQGGQQL